MGALEHKVLKGIEKAAALHQQGRLEEAAAAYRRLASDWPQAWQPAYLLGLLELQQGKLDAACSQLLLATERGADLADAWFHLGECRFGLRQFTEAADCYRRALVRAPKHSMSAFNLGRSLEQLGDMPSAAQAYRNALTLQPAFPEALNNLAVTLRTLGDSGAAAAALRQAIEIQPDFMPAYVNLAHLLDEDAADSKAAIAVLRGALEQRGDFVPAQFHLARLLVKTKAWASAGIAYHRVVELEPAHAEAWCNLGALYLEANLVARAEGALQRAVTLDPQLAQAWGNLGSVLRHRELFDRAQAAFSTAVQLRPDIAQFYLGLGLVYSDRGDLDNAREWLQRALELQADVPEIHAALANVLQRLGDTDGAGQAYTRALELEDHPGLRIKRAMMLSPVMQSLDALVRERACFEAQLNALIVEPVIASQEDLLKYPDTAFYLAYHGRNDRLLLEKLAKVFRLACPPLGYVADSGWRERAPGPIRIGFVSRFFHSHVVARFFGPLIDHLARQSNFDVYLIPVGERQDSEIERLAAVCQGCERLSTLSLPKARDAIAQLELDILVYPEIGMDPFTYLLAYSHLARVQCVLQGHSITTGLSSIDFYISSDWVEPPDAQAQYTEALVRLDALPICLQPPPTDVPPVSRQALGLPEQGTFYLCPMKLQKIHPDMDQAVAAILRNDPAGHVAFVRDDAHPSWHRVIAERIALAAPECVDRLHFVPWAQTTSAFLGLIAAADVVLDSFYHGGATTSHLCLSSGAPMVAWDAGSARSGYIVAYYRLLGLDECIARTQEEYVQIALLLGRDRARREQIRAHILTNRARLYDNQRTFDAYARFFCQALEPVHPPAVPGDPYRMLEGLRSFCRRTDAPIAWIEPSCLAIVPGPAIFEQSYRERARQIRLPDGYLAELTDVEVIGGQSFVLADDLVLCDLVEGPSAERAQLETDVLIHHVGGHALIASTPRAEGIIERGVLLAGRASQNYYHWLLEFLPRLALLEDSGKYQDWPLLIDAGLHPNLKEALTRVCGADRTLVELKRGVRYRVRRLAAPSPLAWMPVDLKPGSVLQPGDVVFSKRATQFLRGRVGAKALEVAPAKRLRLYVARADASYRRLINEGEIQAVFATHGFEIIRPERMSVQEQIEIFASAEIIAGASGAGFTNIVFAPPDTTVLVLYYSQAALFYFTNLAATLGQRMVYLMGEAIVDSSTLAYQCDFRMDPALVERALSKLEAEGPQALVPPEEPATTNRSSRKQPLPFGALGKIGFLTHIPELINHYRCIWEHLGAGRAEVVNAGEGRDAEIIATMARAEGVDCIAFADRLSRSQRYACLVSNHALATGGIPLIKRLGEVNVRLMYAIGKAGWNLSEWNALYDAVLCFGPYHAQSLESVTGAVKIQVGYPRFDAFFRLLPRRQELLTTFGCDPARKTIVWLPTWRDLSSVGWHDEAVASLLNRYNVVVKVHPLMPDTDREKLEGLKRIPFTQLITDSTDNIPLYVIADHMLCDYGGPLFGAVYTDRNVLLLNVPDAASNELTGGDSPDILVRQALANVDPQAVRDLGVLLEDTDLWEQQIIVRRELRRTFFAPHYGHAAQMAAMALLNLEALLDLG